jgi:hypothetical protein
MINLTKRRGATMEKDTTKSLSKVIQIDDDRIQEHLDQIVLGRVEDTLSATDT